MKNYKTLLTVAASALAITTTALNAEEAPKVAAALDVPVLSAYVWRGQVLNDRPVLQPGLTVSKNGFWINAWASYNLDKGYAGDNDHEFSEVDFTAAYTKSFGPVTVEGGLLQYLFPNQTLTSVSDDGSNTVSSAYPGSHEVYVKVSLPNNLLAPSAVLYYDFDAADGFYGNIGINPAYKISDVVSVSATASLGAGNDKYNSYYFAEDSHALNDANVGLSLPITLSPSLVLKPAVTYTWLVNDTISDNAKGLYKDNKSLWGGATLSYTF